MSRLVSDNIASIPLTSPSYIPATNAKTTVIIGAGVSGLSTAYSLAKRYLDKHQYYRIIVIDALEDLFGAASLYNSGILSYQWFSGDLKAFGEYTYAFYEDLAAQDECFRKCTGYRDHSNFKLTRGDRPSDVGAPDWLSVPKGWHIEKDPVDGRAATINPTGLGEWLLRQCKGNGVEVYNLARILKAQISSSGNLERVQLCRGGQITDIPCHNLVFAAGVWTPQLFDELFPNSNVTFCPTTNSGNWMIVKSPEQPLVKNTGQVILDDFVGHQLELVGRNDGNIWINGLDNTKTCLGDVKGSQEPDKVAILRYLEYAKGFLVSSRKSESAALRVIAKGRTYRPTIGRTLPIVARVEPRKLCSSTAPNDKGTGYSVYASQGGVFICSGHGRYGITLGLGSGRLMSQIIIGEPTDIDVSSLGLPSSGVKEIVFQ